MNVELNQSELRHELSQILVMARAVLLTLVQSPNDAKDYCQKEISLLERMLRTLDNPRKEGGKHDV